MIAKCVAPSTVMVVTMNAPGGTSPCAVPPLPLETFPVGFQLIGQNGLRVPASTLNEDLFFTVTATGSSARSEANPAKIEMPRTKQILFIVSQWRWWRRWRPVEIAAVRAGHE